MVPNFELVRAGVDNFGFLVRRFSRLSFVQFARKIRRYSQDPHALEVAKAVEATPGEISRGWRRLSAQWSA